MAFDPNHALQTLKHVEKFLGEHHIDCDDRDLVLKRSFNEAWFSNTLAWLLDPKGSHGLGTDFLKGFLKNLAEKRSNSELGYDRKDSFLRRGREGQGQTISGLSLGNASVAREFFLAGDIGRDAEQNSRFCDLVLMDLDPNDGLFVTIENKLFTTNHSRQLEQYYRAIESRYSRAKIREYVYLTFHKFKPQAGNGGDAAELKRTWLQCSWTGDIAGILSEHPKAGSHRELIDLLKILKWLNDIYSDKEESKAEEFRLQILYATAYCLEEELNRYGAGRPGSWSIVRQGKTVQLLHSSFPASPLTVELLPSLSVAVQGHRSGGQASFEKIVVPYGVNADQVFNLVEIAARDIYKIHFRETANSYLNTYVRRSQNHDSERQQAVKPLFNFVAAHFDALRVLFTVSHNVWDQGPSEE